jgi:DNA-directed RNA polymerase subunit RPC12/RpoP
MSKPIVRCRCGHQVLAKEVLRTDLYERRASEGSSREYVYVKYRCQRCKRMGEAFVPESRWDRSVLEPAPNEMNDTERDQFLDESPISDDEVLDFHQRLQALSNLNDLNGSAREAVSSADTTPEISAAASDATDVAQGDASTSAAAVPTLSPQIQSVQPTPPHAATPAAAQPSSVQPPSAQSPAARGTKSNPSENTPPNQASAGCPPEEPHSKVFRSDT